MVHIPMDEDVLLVVEIHVADETVTKTAKAQRFQSAGWGYLDLFGEGSLLRGYHKLKLFGGPFTPSSFETALRHVSGLPVPAGGKKPSPNDAVLYVRVFGPSEDLPTLDLSEPGDHENLFLTPRNRPIKGFKDDRPDLPAPVKPLSGPPEGS